jgi:hypothetical protein
MHRGRTVAVCASASAGLLIGLIISLGAQDVKGVPSNTVVKIDAHRSLGAARKSGNLTLIPVYDSTAPSTNTYITLDEGLKQKVVKVKESSNGGEVNTLYITNGSGKPLYLMAGEVVLGGQQDRALGKDTIIPPDKKDQPVTVFCVEHGRWTGHKEFAESAKTVVAGGIRGSAQEGAFSVGLKPAADQDVDAHSAGIVLNQRSASSNQHVTRTRTLSQVDGRGVDIGSAQQQVWDKVAAKNKSFKATPTTGTYREVLNLTAGAAHKGVKPYIDSLANSLGHDPHLVGVVTAINGKVVAADIFGEPALFQKLWPKLLRSYAADAAEITIGNGKAAADVTPAMAKAFLVAASDASTKTENRSEISTTLRLESKSALSYRLVPAAKPGMASGGGMGGAVHENVLGK